MGKVIYQRQYPKENIGIEVLKEEFQQGEPDELPPFQEYMNEIACSTTLFLLPARIRGSKEFIAKAKEVSEYFEMDITITEHDSHISVALSFDCAGCMGKLKQITSLADDVAFFSNIHGKDITMCLDYYTHAVVRNGRVVAPRQWE